MQRDGFWQRSNRLDRCSAAMSQRRSACGALLESLQPQTRRARRGEGHKRRVNCLSMALPHRRSGKGPVRRCRCSLARPGRGRGRRGCCRGRHRANYSRAAACRPKPPPALSTRTTLFQESPQPAGSLLGVLSRVARKSVDPMCHVLLVTRHACQLHHMLNGSFSDKCWEKFLTQGCDIIPNPFCEVLITSILPIHKHWHRMLASCQMLPGHNWKFQYTRHPGFKPLC